MNASSGDTLIQLVVATALLAVSYRVEVTTPDIRPTPRPSLTPFGMAGRFVPTGVEVARQPQRVAIHSRNLCQPRQC